MSSRWYRIHFSFQTSLPHFESGLQAWYYFYCIIHAYPSQCGSWLSLLGMVGFQVAPASLHSSGFVSSLGSTRGGSIGLLIYQSMSVLSHLWKSTTSGSLGIECFPPPFPRHIRWVVCLLPQIKFPWFYQRSWQNMSQVSSDFVFQWHLVGWRLFGFPQFSACWKLLLIGVPL